VLIQKGFVENKKASSEGGLIAGNARKELERKSGKEVVVRNNYKQFTQKSLKK
jgi:hypothetical protein